MFCLNYLYLDAKHVAGIIDQWIWIFFGITTKILLKAYLNKHLMTGLKGNSEFCFPETLNVSRGEAAGNGIEVKGNKTHCSLRDQSLSVLLYLLTQN